MRFHRQRCLCLLLGLLSSTQGYLSQSSSHLARQLPFISSSTRLPVSTSNNTPKQSPSPASSHCFTEDEHVFRLLQDLRIRPPWRTPECSTRTFNYILRALADAGLYSGGPKAEAVLRYMLESGRDEIRPDTITLNTVLDAYSKARTGSLAAKRLRAASAQRVFDEWPTWCQQGKVDGDVDRISYNTLLSALGKAQQPDEAERVFEELKERYEQSGDDAWAPDSVTYSSLLHALAIAGQADKVGAVFQRQQEVGPPPTIHSYNGVLYAYSRSHHPLAAEEFLQWWQEEDEGSVRPDTRSYNIVLHALSQSHAERAQRLFDRIPRPDPISYTTLATALSKLPDEHALQAIDRLVDRAWKDGCIHVDAGFIANVLYAVAECYHDATMPEFAERLVRDMQVRGVSSSLAVYNALLYCWNMSNQRQSAQRVIELLQGLEHHAVLQPDIKSYTTVLTTLSKGRDVRYAAEAESIMERLEASGMTLNVQIYTALIHNYARSRLKDKATRAAAVLERMRNRGIRPNIIAYNAVLNACEHTDATDPVHVEEALKMACVVFDEIRTASKANHVTYGTFLGALANLMPAGARTDIVELVFRRCCMEGLVSPLVLKKLDLAAEPEEHYRALLRGHDEDRLPVRWTCNVRETRARNEYA